VIARATAQVSLSNLSQVYTGQALAATATTTPQGLNVTIAYSQINQPATPVGAGSYMVTATVDDANYQGTASGTLTITRATPTITWATPAAITYGTALSGAQLNATASAAGTFGYSPAAGTVLGAGTQTLSVSFTPADATNYTTATMTVQLTVLKAALSVKADDQSRTYGAANPPLTGSLTGVVAGDTITASYSTAATTSAPVGAYAITATLGDPAGKLSNYALTATNGTLAITKATQTLSFGTLPDRTYGDPPFAVSAAASSGLPVGFSASGSCTVGGSTVTLTGAGSCTITASQVGNANYLAAPSVARTFQVLAPTAPTAPAAPATPPTPPAPPAAPPASAPTYYTLTLSTTGGGSASGGGSYPAGAVATLAVTPDAGAVFTGWTVDGVSQCLPVLPLTITMNADHAVVANFAARPSFPDVSPGDPAYEAITQLAARGVIRGYQDGRFGPNDSTLRAQMAALVARAMCWDAEDHGNNFPDRGSVDANLWRNVGTLAYYNVARGYQDGTYKPTNDVLYAQTISFITRAMVTQGYWVQQPDNPALYPNVPASSGHREDLATFVYYAGAVPGTNATANWDGWNRPSTRAWFAQALWQALGSYMSGARAQ
jgi:hypothetical protein